MSWSFVGSVTTGNVSSNTTGSIALPAGVNGGDLIVVACCFYNTTFTQASFTTQQSTHGAQNAHDCFWMGTRIAGGAAGSGTTDSTFTITFGATTWGEWVVGVWRATNGVGSIVGSAEYDSASAYQTSCPDAVYTPAAGNLSVWGYAGQNSSVGTTATSFSGTAPTALTNFVQQGTTGNGGGVGMGWQTASSSPGGATANQAVDPTDFALEVAEAAGPVVAIPLPQPGSIQFRRRYRRAQPVPLIPPTTTALAGLAAGTGTAFQPAALVEPNAGLAAGTGTAQPPSAPGPVAAGLATGTGTAQPPVALVEPNAGLAHAAGTALQPVAQVTALAGLATGTGTALAPSTTGSTMVFPGLAAGTGTALQPGVSVTAFAGLAHGTGTALAPSAPGPVKAGLAHGTGTAFSPAGLVRPGAGLAHGTGTAFGITFPPQPPHWGVTFSEPGPSATLTESGLGATLAAPGFGGALTLPHLGGSLTLVSPSATCTIQGYGATLVLASLGAVITGGTMQQASLTLSEFNDMTISIAVTNNGSPFNLTGYNLSLLLKSAAGVPDSSALIFSSTGGSPAITITSASGGLATAQLPNVDLDSEQYTFYRLDVVNASSQQQTTVYGPITWITL